MAITLTCPQCTSQLRVGDELAGKKIKCPKCDAITRAPVPESAAITAETPPAEPEEIEVVLCSPDEIDDEEFAGPTKAIRDVRRNPAEEAVSTIIPYKNGRALAAYYLGVFSLIPCLGLMLGPAAFVLGLLGMRYVKAHPTAKGTGHAIAGIILGGLTTLANWGFLVAMLVMGGIAAITK
jgi:predicted Zn finger-like uncharacterized protein